MAASGSDLGCSIVGNLCCLSRSLLVVDQVFFTCIPGGQRPQLSCSRS